MQPYNHDIYLSFDKFSDFLASMRLQNLVYHDYLIKDLNNTLSEEEKKTLVQDRKYLSFKKQYLEKVKCYQMQAKKYTLK